MEYIVSEVHKPIKKVKLIDLMPYALDGSIEK